MDSSRLRVLACLAGACGLLVGAGCDPVRAARPARSPIAADPFDDPTLRSGKPRVLVLMPEFPQTLEVWASLRQELRSDFDVVSRRIEPDAEVELIAQAIASVGPACIVVMDNPTLRLYKTYQRDSPPNTKHPPAIVVMTSFLEEQAGTLKNVVGIAYEVPAVTQFAHLRTLLRRPMKRVGVVHRGLLSGFIERQRELTKAESIELVSVKVGDAPDAEELRAALDRLVVQRGVHALWVLNDNTLLTPELLELAWLPAISGERPIPVVVGVASLVANSQVGTFAMIPDHEALGAQAAGLIFELADEAFQSTGKLIEAPVAIKTIINGKQARSYFGFNDALRAKVDEVVE